MNRLSVTLRKLLAKAQSGLASVDSQIEQLHSQAESLAAVSDQGNGTTASYIDEAILLVRQALELGGPHHRMRSLSLTLLAAHLSTRYDQLGSLKDLEEAIDLDREALSLRPQGHPDHSKSLNNLAIDLSTRYNHLGRLQDLEDAIILDRKALALRPKGHPDHSKSLNNLAADLSTRYDQLGALQDLEEAIILDREALSLRPEGHPDRSASLNNLAIRLSSRYNQLRVLQDLEEAIVLDREALSLRPQGHPDRAKSLNNLAADLSARCDQLGALQDLEEAIVLDREALSLRQLGQPDRSASLNNLAIRLFSRYNQLGALQDLEEAIVLDREALSLRPQGHPDRSTSLNNLAIRLSARYHQLGASRDLEDAIVFCREAVSLRSPGHPDRSTSLNNLATDLNTRYHQFVSRQGLPDPSTISDVQEIFTLYRQLADISRTASAVDLDASRAWIQAAENFNHHSILLAYETFLRLLVEHFSLLPTLSQHLDVLSHSSSLAVDAFSACLRNGAPKRAAELLEQGRGVFWSQLTRLRSPLDDVVASGPAGETLAEEFTRLSLLIRMALDSPGMDQHEQLCQHNLEMQRVVTAIRNVPDCSRFFLPSLFSDLRRAATAGPVIVVNASQYGCDALIIFEDRDLVHVPLSITKQHVQCLSSTFRIMTARAAATNTTNALCRILRELWDDVVSPVVRVLQMTYPLQSRIWWCPTAEFSTLPLHAAGPYRKGQPSLASLYVSSYTPTLSVLIRARRPRSPTSTSNVKRFVGIGQANAPGQNHPLAVSSELADIAQHVHDAAPFTRVEGAESSIQRVVEALGQNAWVHLACHAYADADAPFESALALGDGRLTIARLVRCDVDVDAKDTDAELAYLSASHTVGSTDERIDWASAMLFLGFRGVVGTMGAVEDGVAGAIAAGFWGRVRSEGGALECGRAAGALEETMKAVGVPIDQRVLWVHVGA